VGGIWDNGRSAMKGKKRINGNVGGGGDPDVGKRRLGIGGGRDGPGNVWWPPNMEALKRGCETIRVPAEAGSRTAVRGREFNNGVRKWRCEELKNLSTARSNPSYSSKQRYEGKEGVGDQR